MRTNYPTLSREQMAHYNQQGYLVVEELLTDDEVDAFVRHETECTDRPRHLQLHREDEKWLDLAHHPMITGVVQQLLAGHPSIVQTMYMNKQAQGGTGIALHQDTHYIRNEPNSLMACWLAMSDTDAGNGGLCVVPGSNQKGLYEFSKVRDESEHTSWERDYPMRDRSGKEWAETMHSFDIEGVTDNEVTKLTVRKGAGVFFTGMTVHGSYANYSTDRPRLAFATHYIREDTWIYRTDIQDTIPVR